jgi:hypothetical protein
LLVEFLRPSFVLTLFIGKIIEQLAYAGVLRARCSFFIEAARFDFHRGSFFANRFDAQRADQPQGWPFHKSADVLAANQRNVFAEFLLI